MASWCPEPLGIGEVGVEVEEDGARDVAGVVGSSPGTGLAEQPADVHDPKAWLVEPRGQLVHRDERPSR
jgi:hypothetical protein